MERDEEQADRYAPQKPTWQLPVPRPVTGTTHALVGGAIGRLVRRPLRAFLVGIASHALADVLPHVDYRGRPWLLLDGCATLVVLALAVFTGRPGVVAGALGGIALDLELAFRARNPHPRGLFPSHRFAHRARSRREGLAAELLLAAGTMATLSAALGTRRSTERRP